MRRDAILSPCERYRYSLIREWDAALPRLGVLMLNPSTADAESDDNTIRKVVEFARRLGYGGIEVVNLFAYRATDPKDLWAFAKVAGVASAVGTANDSHLRCVMSRCRALLMAYGKADPKGRVESRARWLERQVLGDFPRFSLKKTKDGWPCHPLYLPYELADSVSDHFKVASPSPKEGRG